MAFIAAFDIDQELIALQRAAIAKLDGMLPEITRGQGIRIPNRRGPGDLLMTRPSPTDAQEVQPPDTAFFRITSLDAAGEPAGHSVVGKSAYRAFRDTAKENDIPGRLCDVIDVLKDQIRPDITRGLVGIVMGQPAEYSYRLKYRDHGVGTTPDGVKSASGRDVVFSRPLTSAELAQFEIDPVGAKVLRGALPEPAMVISPAGQ